MKVKRDRKIIRRKVPNLAKEGLKFDSRENSEYSFFSKISNSFKLLQQPFSFAEAKENRATFHIARKNTVSLRMRQLSQPKHRIASHSLIQTAYDASSVPLKGTTVRDEIRSQAHRRFTVAPAYKTPKIVGANQISGTSIAPMPIQYILSLREKQEQQRNLEQIQSFTMKQKIKNEVINDSDEDEPRQVGKKTANKDLFIVKNDMKEWASRIIAAKEGQSYDIYDRRLLEKVKKYRSKEIKINHKVDWK